MNSRNKTGTLRIVLKVDVFDSPEITEHEGVEEQANRVIKTIIPHPDDVRHTEGPAPEAVAVVVEDWEWV